MKTLPLASAVGLCALACASAAYWVVSWSQPAPLGAGAAAARPGSAPPRIEAALALFGGAPVAAAPATAFRLKGVIADGADGVAILAEEGKPAQAVGVGKEVAPGVTVQEVHQRYVLLVEGGTVRRLDLPDSAVAGMALVAGTPTDRSPAPAPAPASAVPARVQATVARSGGAMPLPVANPAIASTPGMTPEQIQQMQQAEQMRQARRMQEEERAHRPPPMGPGGYGPPPQG